jgi:hypothetical protein
MLEQDLRVLIILNPASTRRWTKVSFVSPPTEISLKTFDEVTRRLEIFRLDDKLPCMAIGIEVFV